MRRFCWSGTLVLTLLSAARADAHALGADWKLHGDRVELEAYYDDDTPARDARVRVEDAATKVVAEGRTDAEGRWSFARPQGGDYVIVIDAGAGHRKQLKLAVPAGATPAASDRTGPAIAAGTGPSPSVSPGPSRQEFTAFPWLKLGIGVTVIGGLGLAFWMSRRRGRSAV